MTQPTPVNRVSADINQDRLDRLRQLIPEAFTEGKIDFDKLRAALGEVVDDRPDRYTFTWAGKKDAIRLLQMSTTATLIPDPDESVNWNDANNIFIEGENLEALKLLYKSYFGRVKMIYIDPPYNTGNDFIYPDNYRDSLKPYLQLTGQMDSDGNLLTSNPETSGRYHSAWLNMMYPRLFLARQLLSQTGTIFVSIDDHEVHNLRLIMNEIFGEENFLATVVWEKVYAPKPAAKTFSVSHDYLLVYAKSVHDWERYLLPRTDQQDSRYQNPDNDPRGPWASDNLLRNEHRDNSVYTIVSPTGKEWTPKPGTSWRHPENEMLRLIENNEIWFGRDGNGMPRRKKFLSEVQQGLVPTTIWRYEDVGHTQDAKRQIMSLFDYDVFETPKPIELIKRAAQIVTAEEDIILDFFAGSSSTASSIIDLNREDEGKRKFILVQIPEPVDESSTAYDEGFRSVSQIGLERLHRVVKSEQEKCEEQHLQQDSLGFRVFRLNISNFRSWTGVEDATPEEYTSEMELSTDPVATGANPRAVLWEIAIKEGYSLTSRVEEILIRENTVFHITDEDTDRELYICLDKEISDSLVHELGLAEGALFVVRDIALDDTTAANLALQCRLKTI